MPSIQRSPTDEFIAVMGWPEAYRVGGSVRDDLLGRPAKDHDYVVRGVSLDGIRARLDNARIGHSPLRLRDGLVVGVRAGSPGGLVEITLPRREVSTGGGHRDFRITCDPMITLAEDARRRDFTVNALYADVTTGEVIEPLGEGLGDLTARYLRTTNVDSFRDDPLRMLRCLRFVSTLSFGIATDTLYQLGRHAEAVAGLTLKGTSGTVLDELSKLLMGANVVYALRTMRSTGVFGVALPELVPIEEFAQESEYHSQTLDDHTFGAIGHAAALNASLRVRLALLFHDAGKPWMAWRDAEGKRHYYALTPTQARELGAPPTAIYPHEWWSAWVARNALGRLGATGQLRRDVLTLVEEHMVPLHGRTKPVKVHRWRCELGDGLLADLLLHRRCDVLAKGHEDTEALAALDRLVEIQERAISEGVPMCVKDLAVGGRDLLDLGLKGPAVGDVHCQLLDEVLAQPKLNEREWLLGRAQVLAKGA